MSVYEGIMKGLGEALEHAEEACISDGSCFIKRN